MRGRVVLKTFFAISAFLAVQGVAAISLEETIYFGKKWSADFNNIQSAINNADGFIGTDVIYTGSVTVAKVDLKAMLFDCANYFE